MGSTETYKFQSCLKRNQCLEELRNVLIRKGEVRQKITKKKDSTWRVFLNVLQARTTDRDSQNNLKFQ